MNPGAGAMGIFGRNNHVISNAGLRSVLEKNLPYKRLEEAKVPVHVITTDFRTGRAVVLSSGPAVPALLASTAIPGVFPPVTVGRRELVDGGVANHPPMAAATDLGARRAVVPPPGQPGPDPRRANGPHVTRSNSSGGATKRWPGSACAWAGR